MGCSFHVRNGATIACYFVRAFQRRVCRHQGENVRRNGPAECGCHDLAICLLSPGAARVLLLLIVCGACCALLFVFLCGQPEAGYRRTELNDTPGGIDLRVKTSEFLFPITLLTGVFVCSQCCPHKTRKHVQQRSCLIKIRCNKSRLPCHQYFSFRKRLRPPPPSERSPRYLSEDECSRRY